MVWCKYRVGCKNILIRLIAPLVYRPKCVSALCKGGMRMAVFKRPISDKFSENSFPKFNCSCPKWCDQKLWTWTAAFHGVLQSIRLVSHILELHFIAKVHCVDHRVKAPKPKTVKKINYAAVRFGPIWYLRIIIMIHQQRAKLHGVWLKIQFTSQSFEINDFAWFTDIQFKASYEILCLGFRRHHSHVWRSNVPGWKKQFFSAEKQEMKTGKRSEGNYMVVESPLHKC